VHELNCFHKKGNHCRDHGTVTLGLVDSINHLSATPHLMAMDNLSPWTNALVSRLPNREKKSGNGRRWRQESGGAEAGDASVQDTSGTRPKCAREHKLAFNFLPFESPATKLHSQAHHGLVRLMGIIVAVDTRPNLSILEQFNTTTVLDSASD
jgi:hypothetical protein